MTASTLTITEFLLARLDEDEMIARRWQPRESFLRWFDHYEHKVYDDVSSLDLSGDYVLPGQGGMWSDGKGGPQVDGIGLQQAYGAGEDCRIPRDVGDHIVRWQPARVLAEVAAKRRILAEHPATEAGQFPHLPDGAPDMTGWIETIECGRCGMPYEYDVPWPCPTVRALASVYADHSEYRQEWANGNS